MTNTAAMDGPRTSYNCLDIETEGSTLENQNDISNSKMYIKLGLKGQTDQSHENPKVLALISSRLQKLVETNDKLLQTTQTKDVPTVFHGSRAPALTIQQYIDRIFKYSRCSPSCFVVAQVYIDRLIQSEGIILTSLNVHRLLITSVMLAAKFIDERYCLELLGEDSRYKVQERPVHDLHGACGVEENRSRNIDDFSYPTVEIYVK